MMRGQRNVKLQMAYLTGNFGSDKIALKTRATETSRILFKCVKQKKNLVLI